MIDKQGYRLNVGIILVNNKGKVFLGKRCRSQDAWQFPQGGVKAYETLEETMYRELIEEVGLEPESIKILGVTKRWIRYLLPHAMRKHNKIPLCIGQKQKWFLLSMLADDDKIHLERTSSPEFCDWRWVDYWYPLEKVIAFKREVYKQALQELEPLVKTK
jgi:putative (di)nucleoside polyphosphate hydrolase